jgi:hypothetical protein
MSTRNERRRKAAEIKKKLRNRQVRQLVLDELKNGSAGTEVYRLDDDGTGKPMFFNITAMREWAEQNLEIFMMPPDFSRAERLIESGAVDRDHIMNHTVRTKPKPMLVCRGLLGGDQIVDGAHRFVALCMGVAMFRVEGAGLPGYVLMPDQWQKFVIPPAVARICKFGEDQSSA